MKKYKVFILLVLVLILTKGCVSLKPYQMIYVNDPEMQMGNSPAEGFEVYVESIREGAVTPASSKSGGGCGCN